MPTYSVLSQSIILLSTSLLLAGCSGTRPDGLGVMNGKLSQCPPSPNCVSSYSTDEPHLVPSMHITASPEIVWGEVKQYLNSQANFTIISENNYYYHVECASKFFGFIDDFEIYLRPQDRIITVRSASRLGYSDFGVNQARTAHFREHLLAIKLINME